MSDAISEDEFAAIASQMLAFRPDPDGRYRLALSTRDGCLIMTLTGTLLQPIATEFGHRLDDLFAHETARRAIIDLSGCDYLSSSAFGVLMEWFKASTSQGGQVLLIRPQPKIAKLISILGLDRFFLIVDDLETSIAYYRTNTR
jgi:anti-anti-sigma factor